MSEIVRPSGLRISLPDALRISAIEPDIVPLEARRRAAAPTLEKAFDGPEAFAVVVEALEGQDMQLVDSFELEPASSPLLGVRRWDEDAGRSQVVPLSLDVQSEEEAAVLVEQDGFYSWTFPVDRAIVEADSSQQPRQKLGFSMRVDSAQEVRRGLLDDFIPAKIKVLVLKFAVRIAIGATMKLLESNVKPGLVVMNLEGPERWQRVDDMRNLPLPRNRAAKILLFVHGTFSSTVGSFGALANTPWGRSFLKNALAAYDFVLGFDHPTLGDDPKENAVDLLDRLRQGEWRHAPKVDSIAFSRGALVLRCLIEQLLPAADWQAQFERAVFVGAASGGTALAEPDNWKALVDLHTNLVAAAARQLGVLPCFVGLSSILAGAMQGLGALVKWIANEALSGNRVPGLAAMEPDGPFIAELNSQKPVGSSSKWPVYHAVVSEFEPSASHQSNELPPRLLQQIADGFVDQLMKGAANDLVVDTASMSTFGPYGESERCNLGRTSQIHHLNYFVRPEVIKALARWLLQVSSLPRSLRRDALAREIPAVVDTDILVVEATTTVGQTAGAILSTAPSAVVMRRMQNGRMVEHAMRSEDLLAQLSGYVERTSLADALSLAVQPLPVVHSLASVQMLQERMVPERNVEVVLSGSDPVGVLIGRSCRGKTLGLAEMARCVMEPRNSEELLLSRRFMPLQAHSRQHAVHSVQALEEGPFRAEMDDEVLLGRIATVEATVVRDSFVDLAMPEVDPTQRLMVEIVPKRNFELVDVERLEVLEMDPSRPQVLYFDVRATNDDGSGKGELWFVVSQGQTSLARFVMQSRIVKTRSGPRSRAVSVVVASEASCSELS